jgi:hypothetical protein
VDMTREFRFYFEGAGESFAMKGIGPSHLASPSPLMESVDQVILLLVLADGILGRACRRYG